MENERNLKQRGITLIALVITIIILLIIAGVTISALVGENGLLNKTTEAELKANESTAKEKLKLVLFNANIDKESETGYNKDEYLTKLLENEGMIVNQNVITVDGWNFLIDRDKLEILESQGESNINITYEPKVYLGQNSEGNYEMSILLKIESNIKMSNIVVAEPDGTISSSITNPDILILGIDKDIELDKEYTVTVNTEDGKTFTKKIIEKSVQEISKVDDLVTFRNNVNSGLTYEGKTMTLTDNIDLSSICGSTIGNWEPIGSETSPFSGIFEGGNNTISNIYINTTESYQGLFGVNAGTIRDIKINGNIVSTGNYIGGISGINKNTICNCHNNTYIQGMNCAGIVAINQVNAIVIGCSNTNEIHSTGTSGNPGGISGQNYGEIKQCFNKGYVHSDYTSAGGISGYQCGGSTYNCYNLGKIYSKNIYAGGISGVAGGSGYPTAYTYNCYNIGNLIGRHYSEITGLDNGNSGTSKSINCYTTNVTTNLLNSGSYSDNVWTDDTGINNGYPILKWQVSQ